MPDVVIRLYVVKPSIYTIEISNHYLHSWVVTGDFIK